MFKICISFSLDFHCIIKNLLRTAFVRKKQHFTFLVKLGEAFWENFYYLFIYVEFTGHQEVVICRALKMYVLI